MGLERGVEAIVGRPVIRIDEIPGAGGYTPALRRIASLADGSTVFVKAAVNDLTAGWIEAERRSYEAMAGAPFVPRYIGCADGILVLEDLRDAHWPPPWRAGDIDRVLAMLDRVASYPVPAIAVDLEAAAGPMLRSWRAVRDDPGPFLDLGVCSSAWFERAAPALVGADDRGSLVGDALVHFDVRSDNLCLVGDRAVLVDWNGTARGRPDFDRTCFAQTLAHEGGPAPHEVLPGADPALVAMLAGYFADRAPQPPIADAPRVRDIQRAQLQVCLPWAARLLDLPPPA